MTRVNDLTRGSISKGIWSMAIPLITASFVQMAYSMTDMIWLGRLGSESVAAVGVAAHECGHAIQHAIGYVAG